ncbi:4'-phosphopantetheinyl transferase family protein [Undibacterium fentianense]|uniref:4'-phosphopantetheinyl transferase superfamily protein n=1 Tax=Undibacterium fentianense TaxID=2828728 RepID=A0A941E0G9_9BURK|nr:4'-phosphopantetheinyl transferase superfamily protein [Undibacterium fentianense]MBR7798762.1 4'-phosphopantetheinyl transferase superfamily protein [Undibacterium fentianense]
MNLFLPNQAGAVVQQRLLSHLNMKHGYCVFEFPNQIDAACAFYRQHDFVVLFNQAEGNHDRTISRTSLRAAVKQFLGLACAVDKDKIQLHAEAGQAPYAQVDGERIFLSFSHDQNYAVAAIHRYQNIGIDLLATAIDFDWREVARLYLSPVDNQGIANAPEELQAKEFAACWAIHEARLKCCGLALQEWSAELDVQLNQCEVHVLHTHENFALPKNLVMALTFGFCK